MTILIKANIHAHRRPAWQEMVAMGLTMSLIDRMHLFEAAIKNLKVTTLREAGVIEGANTKGDGWTCHLDGPYDSLVGFIEDKLGLNFFDAARWALELIENSPHIPDNNDCRCEDDNCSCVE